VGIFSSLFREMGMQVQSCNDEQEATKDIAVSKYEALVLDCDDLPDTIPVIRNVRDSRSNKNAVVFAVATDGQTRRRVFDEGANFTFERPLVVPQLKMAIRAAYGLMLRERRRYFRYAIGLQVRIRRDSGVELECQSINISQNGMAVNCPSPLQIGESLGIVFSMPAAALTVSARGTVVWGDGHAKAGISFVCTSADVQNRLAAWLVDQFYTQFDIAKPAKE